MLNYIWLILFYAYALQFVWVTHRAARHEYFTIDEIKKDLIPFLPLYRWISEKNTHKKR